MKSWISRRHDMPKLLYELEKLSKVAPSVQSNESTSLARYAVKPAQEAEPAKEEKQEQQPVSVQQQVIWRTYDERRTRRADLPPELQQLYDTISEDYKLRRGLHEKMKMAQSNKDRAHYRALVLETDGRIRGKYAQIDGFLERQAEEQAKDGFNESTCRAYISKALKREQNSSLQVATCKARVKALLDHGCTINPETLANLKTKGLC